MHQLYQNTFLFNCNRLWFQELDHLINNKLLIVLVTIFRTKYFKATIFTVMWRLFHTDCWSWSCRWPFSDIVLIYDCFLRAHFWLGKSFHKSLRWRSKFKLRTYIITYLSLINSTHNIHARLLEWLKVFFWDEGILRLMIVYKDLYVYVTRNHSSSLADFLGRCPKVFTYLVQVSTKLLKIVLDEIDNGIITFLYSVKNRFVRYIKHVDSQIEFIQATFVLIPRNICLVLLLL